MIGSGQSILRHLPVARDALPQQAHSQLTLANWRRERADPTVHIVVEAAPFTLCGQERETLGATIWDEGAAARDLCRTCSLALLAATNEAARLGERITSEPELVLAKDALRGLQRMVPDGRIRDLIVYARACIARGDKKGAHDSVKRWRESMCVIGVFARET